MPLVRTLLAADRSFNILDFQFVWDLDWQMSIANAALNV